MAGLQRLESMIELPHAFVADDTTDEDKHKVVGSKAEVLTLLGTEHLYSSVIDIGNGMFREVSHGLTA